MFLLHLLFQKEVPRWEKIKDLNKNHLIVLVPGYMKDSMTDSKDGQKALIIRDIMAQNESITDN